jgi:hypothetical protein
MGAWRHLRSLYVYAESILELGVEQKRFECSSVRKRGWTPICIDPEDDDIEFWRAIKPEAATALMMVSEILKALRKTKIPSRASQAEVVRFAEFYSFLRQGLASAVHDTGNGLGEPTLDEFKATIAAAHNERSRRGGQSRRKFKTAEQEEEVVSIVEGIIQNSKVSPSAACKRAALIVEKKLGIRAKPRTSQRIWKRQNRPLSN